MDNSFDQGLGLASTAYDARDYRLAFQLYLRLAMEGCVPAQRWVALLLDVGEGCRKDPAVAARLRGLAEAISPRGTDQTAKRLRGLKETLTGIAAIVG